MAGNYVIGDIYQGGYSSLNPEGGEVFTGYRGNVSQLGVSTDPRTANILKEFSDKIAPGQKVMELSLITPEVLEAVPKQHLKEIHRLSKLTGVEPTVHGPLIDASGVNQQGIFEDANRQLAERKILQALERSHDINPDGNIPVTFHTANQLPGAKYNKPGEKLPEETEIMPIVNQDTGQINFVKKTERYYPQIKDTKLLKSMRPDLTDEQLKSYHPEVNEGDIIKETHSVDEQLRIMNNSDWDNNLQQLIIPKEHADRILRETYPLVAPIKHKIEIEGVDVNNLTPEQKNIYLTYNSSYENAYSQLGDVQKHLNSIFDKAYSAYENEGDKDGINYLKGVVQEFSKSVKGQNVLGYSMALQNFMEKLRPDNLPKNVHVPKVFVPAEEYALKKSYETYGNAAWEAYKKFGEKTPIINIENPPAGFGLSRAEDLKRLVEGSQKKFVENAVKNGMSEKQAEREAKKMIGVTWDVGHINQLRQFGFSSEDIIKEAEKIAPHVRHIHLSDNFGYENVELPMGMGNVDFKEIMERLKKKGAKVDDMRKIVEAAHWWQFQQSNPIGVSMEALGSPIYSMKMGPYWNQATGFQQGYFGGYGAFLPQINYETMGAGFSQLPQELGGQRQGGRGSRMSGTPME